MNKNAVARTSIGTSISYWSFTVHGSKFGSDTGEIGDEICMAPPDFVTDTYISLIVGLTVGEEAEQVIEFAVDAARGRRDGCKKPTCWLR